MLGWTDPEIPPDGRRLSAFSPGRELARRRVNLPDPAAPTAPTEVQAATVLNAE
jgi:hypothetical protein